jgi:hypothetical protein
MSIYSIYIGNFEVITYNLDTIFLRKQMTDDNGVGFHINLNLFLLGKEMLEQYGRIEDGVGVFSRCVAPNGSCATGGKKEDCGWRSRHSSGAAGILNGRVI